MKLLLRYRTIMVCNALIVLASGSCLAADNRDGTPAAATVAPNPTFEKMSFRVTSILIGDGRTPSLAVINGRKYGEGEFLRLPKISSLRVRLKQINGKDVVLEHDNQTLVVPLQRPEPKQNTGDTGETKPVGGDAKPGEAK